MGDALLASLMLVSSLRHIVSLILIRSRSYRNLAPDVFSTAMGLKQSSTISRSAVSMEIGGWHSFANSPETPS